MPDFLMYRRPLHSMQRLYNRINRFYGRVEHWLGPKFDMIVTQKVVPITNRSECTALEYACGSGLLTCKLAPLFKTVTGRDLSSGMLDRAKVRADRAGLAILFAEGNILAIDEAPKSYDYVFISFALHLFPIETEKTILQNLLKVARRAVIVIDHDTKWRLGVAIAEWLEGGYYDRFIKTDFRPIAAEIGASSFDQSIIQECTVMTFFV